MGKQICFFATRNDYFTIFDFLLKNRWVLIDESGNSIPFERAKQMVTDHYNGEQRLFNLYITKYGLNIVKKVYPNITFVDSLFSDVIEITVCSPPPPNIEGLVILPNQYEHGRLWYEKRYYDENGNAIAKCDDLDKMYNSLTLMIKSQAIISTDKFAYILPDAYKLYKEGRFIPCSGKIKINFN